MDERGLDLVFGALADATRRAMLARLASGEADVSELMAPFGLSQPTISKHLKVLERAGFVAIARDAQRRPRSLVLTPLQDVDEWLTPFRRLWEKRFQRLDAYLREQQTTPTPPKPTRRRRTRS
jgi:DNA-binding transcriptional ArsR family regulator